MKTLNHSDLSIETFFSIGCFGKLTEVFHLTTADHVRNGKQKGWFKEWLDGRNQATPAELTMMNVTTGPEMKAMATTCTFE